MALFKLCAFDELDQIDSRGFVIADVSPERNIFIVRNKDKIVGYENSCPHNFAPLDWAPNQFLSYDKDYIQCANHGALFEIEDGRCIYGPCAGKSLRPVNIVFEENLVFASL